MEGTSVSVDAPFSLQVEATEGCNLRSGPPRKWELPIVEAR